MSFNQIRPDRSDNNLLHRRSGRSSIFNHPRAPSATLSKPGPAGASPNFPANASNRSAQRNNNAQGGQPRVGFPALHSSDSGHESMLRGLPNGAHRHPSPPGLPDAPVSSTVTKPTQLPATQRSNTVPAQAATLTPDTSSPITPTKASGDQLKGFSFQFGTISPVTINKMSGNTMQIPARTSSAPPNLDEQKRDQARHQLFQTEPRQPTPLAPKQQVLRKDSKDVAQSNIAEVPPMPKSKGDVQASPTLPTNQTQKPSVSVGGISISKPFQQPQVPGSFAGPNQQIQSHGITATSLHMPPMPIPMQMGRTQVQQQIYVSGLPPHPLQPQGIAHQGPGLGFTAQISSQLPPQSGSLGINMSTPQYPQQPGGKYVGQRKSSVRITDPKTREEVKFDSRRTDVYTDSGSSGSRSHPTAPPPSQPLQSYTHMNYYHNSYSHGSTYFPTPSSIPLTSGHIAPNSQAQMFNYPLTQSAQTVTFMNPSTLGSLPSNKIGSTIHGLPDPSILGHGREASNIVSPAPPAVIHVSVRPPAVSVGERATNTIPSSLVSLEKGEPHIPVRSSGECNPSYSRMDSGLSTENSLQNPTYGSESMNLSVTEKMSAEASVSVVDGKISGNMLSPLSSPSGSGEPKPTVLSNDGRKSELFSRQVGVSDYKIKSDEIQVPEQIQCLPSSGLPDPCNGVSKPGDEETLLGTVIKNSVSETVPESVPSISAFTPDASESKASDLEGTDSIPHTKLVSSLLDEQVKLEPLRNNEQEKVGSYEVAKKGVEGSEHLLDITVEASKVVIQTESGSVLSTPVSNEVPTLEAAVKRLDEPVICHYEVDRIATDSDLLTSTTMDSINAVHSQGDGSSILSASSYRNENRCSDKDISSTGGQVDHLPTSSEPSDLVEVKHKGERTEIVDPSGVLLSTQVSSNKSLQEINKGKTTATRSKKKKRDILQKADAAGTTSDLYMAYKGPDGKKETVYIPEGTKISSSSLDLKQLGADSVKDDLASSENKNEPDDWEDAADISIPELEKSDDMKHMSGTLIDEKDGNGNVPKSYSKDFLLKFAEQFTDLPQGFEVTPDVESLMSIDHDSYPSPGKVDRPSSAGSRAEHDRWSKVSGSFMSGRDPKMDLAFTASGAIRPGVGANFGVLRNPRAQAPAQYAGGILSGPMQSVNSQGGLRNGSDADRWQRTGTNFQKGLIRSPQNPLNTMHKAGKKYEVGKVSDEEEAKQRQLKAILNKLTPQNFDKLFEQVKAVNIDNAKTLTGVISQIFDKALTEPTFCEMYANFCFHLSGGLPDLSEDNEKITFKRLLLNKCQEEFERGEREQEEANKVDEEGEVKQSADEREEKRTMARRRMLGNIRLIGELYKKKMLTERIMHECIKKLLGQSQNPELSETQDPDEEDVEALCKLMSTIGEMIDHPKAKNFMDSYFESMANLSNNMKLSSRVRFMLKDAIELRKNKWQQRRKVEGPKKIEEVHRDAAQERQAQASRLSRGPSSNGLVRKAPTMEFGHKGSRNTSSSNVHGGSFRGFSNQARGYGSQDVRTEPQHSYEARTLTAHLPQRDGDDSITLGPHGGLARGMSIRAPQSVASSPGVEISSIPGDSRRMTGSVNGYSSMDDPASKHVPDRFLGAAAFGQTSAQEQNMNFGNRDLKNSDLTFDRSRPSSPSIRGWGVTLRPTLSSENLLSEDCLQNKSMAAIKEYYSARDEKELSLCIRELNSPSFHPSMISLWISDSFERKDVERDLLAKLLVNLSRSSDRTLSQSQLIKGFENVLADLEDAVSDAPRASEYMGRILARVIVENVVSLGEIGQLIREGGEEPGYLLQIGLAADVLGNVLEEIRVEKGEGMLKEICGSAALQLESFRPPGAMKSRILEKFM